MTNEKLVQSPECEDMCEDICEKLRLVLLNWSGCAITVVIRSNLFGCGSSIKTLKYMIWN